MDSSKRGERGKERESNFLKIQAVYFILYSFPFPTAFNSPGILKTHDFISTTFVSER